MTWSELTNILLQKVEQLSEDHKKRLKFEIAEVEKQGAEAIWVNYYNRKTKFSSNPNNLLIPWLLEMVNDDPLKVRTTQYLNTVRSSTVLQFKDTHGFIPHDLIKDPDSPDIDIDCLPNARDELKEYAISRYGQDNSDGFGSVCSVGTWQTYKFKQALVDTAIALGFISPLKVSHGGNQLMNRFVFEKEYTSMLPDDVDNLRDGGAATCKGKIRKTDGSEKECGHIHSKLVCEKCGSSETDGPTIEKLIAEHEILQKLDRDFSGGTQFPNNSGIRPPLIETAVQLIGRVRNMGMHAGAIIITNRPLFGNIPLSKSGKKGYWTSMWTEGRNTQLSKFGYIKWDFLGLKTLEYIEKCCRLIEANRGISFGKNLEGLEDIDPFERRAGHYYDGDGNKQYISLNDEHAIKLANEQKTDAIFQFDTQLAMSILANGVKSFEDLLFFNAAGHPGPMQCVWSHSKINTTNGLKEIKDLDNNTDAIIAESKNGAVVETNNYKVIKSGVKKLLKIKLENGTEIIVSPDHKIATESGYIKAGGLNIGQKVRVLNESKIDA